MMEPTAHLDAFDRDGIIRGYAWMRADGKWTARIHAISEVFDTISEAVNFLRANGAALVRESDGKKYL